MTIIGAGIAGAACAVALRAAGREVQVIERGRTAGGRMASPTLRGRPVDVGAGYFTVRDDRFARVVDGWLAAGLAREWTDTFAVLRPGREPESTVGPVRWATPGGLRSLVRDLLDGHQVRYGAAEQVLPAGQVVLAMPDPQAARLTVVPDPVGYEPVIAVVCGFGERTWPFVHAAFVNDHADLAFVADDGARRGDGRPVLVAHSTAALARRCLDDPSAAIAPVIGALRDVLGVPDPEWTSAHRWTFAKPVGRHEAWFGTTGDQDCRVWLAGDQWCPQGSPRVESAWLSGTEVAAAINRSPGD